jgi:hypothetical protein
MSTFVLEGQGAGMQEEWRCREHMGAPTIQLIARQRVSQTGCVCAYLMAPGRMSSNRTKRTVTISGSNEDLEDGFRRQGAISCFGRPVEDPHLPRAAIGAPDGFADNPVLAKASFEDRQIGLRDLAGKQQAPEVCVSRGCARSYQKTASFVIKTIQKAAFEGLPGDRLQIRKPGKQPTSYGIAPFEFFIAVGD